MTEPINTGVAAVSLVTLGIALGGPDIGPYLAIVLGAVGGGLWPLSSTTTATRVAGAWLMLRCVITAIVLTAVIASIVGPALHISAPEAYAVVAFVIGALGNTWLELIEAGKTRLKKWISGGGQS